jgi:Tfp pilus assembly protein PilX
VSRRGAILAVSLATLLVVTLLAGVVLRSYLQFHRQMRLVQDSAQAQWLAEGALARAVTQVRQDSEYVGETWKAGLIGADGDPAIGVATITVQPAPDQPELVQIAVESRFPDHPWQRTFARRTLIVPNPNVE